MFDTDQEVNGLRPDGEPDGLTPDQERLGQAAELLVQDGKMQAASLLLDVRAIHTSDLEWREYAPILVTLEVDHFLLERFTQEILDDIMEALKEAYRDVTEVKRLYVRRVIPNAAGWRERVEAALSGNPRNNAVLAPSSRPAIQVDKMLFRDQAEVALYTALKRAQEQALPGDEFAIVPNPAVRLLGGSREPDFLVICKGRCGAIEVDGSSHQRKWSSDRSKDQALEGSGIAFAWRIDAGDAVKPSEADTFIRRFLVRLTNR
jgi:hypothetical protein